MKMNQQHVGTAVPTDKEKEKGEKTRASIGVNLRVTGHCQQGGRKYMEDFFAVAYQQTDDEKDLEYAFFGIFDGHGGAEAAAFAKEHLMEFIVKDPRFWMDADEDVLQSIKEGFIDTHHAMWKIHDKWPKTASGLPSTAGTTASVAFIRRGKIYIGHVGDSGITLGYQSPGYSDWQARSLTKDHKPESEDELARIEQSGGKVISKMGVPRVVWNRPRIGHKGPVRRSTPIDEIPFLAVARSLGDLWSYNATLDEFVVSPKPDVAVIPIDTASFRCLIFGTDGLYNMLSPHMAVHIVQEAERKNEDATLNSPNPHWINPSKTLVERALDRWCNTKMRADNTSVITLMLDPPGPPRAQVLRNQRNQRLTSDKVDQEPAAATAAMMTTEVKRDVDDSFEAERDDDSSGGSNVAAAKLRESTAFDTRADPPPAPPPTVTTLPQVGKKNHNKYKNENDLHNDIQINEVTSSSLLDDDKLAKSKKKNAKKDNIVQRKFNLRSSSNANVMGGTASCAAGQSTTTNATPRAPLGENVAETSRIGVASDFRVLRERRNTTPNSSMEKVFKVKKGNKKKLTISGDKKKLLQNLLFKNKAQPNRNECTSAPQQQQQQQPKTKENNNAKASPSPKQHQLSPLTPGRRSERTKQQHEATARREMRKSTLEQQKVRVPEGIFKAKLRAKLNLNTQSSKIKLKKKSKALSSLKKFYSS